MAYGGVHKYFLRAIMSKGLMTESEAYDVLNAYSDHESRNTKDVIDMINLKIRPLQQWIKQTRHDSTGDPLVVFVSEGGGTAALEGSSFTASELLFFRAVLEGIALAPGKALSEAEAVGMGLSGKGPNLSRTRSHELLEEWQSLHYLQKTERGDFTLGVRGLHEFQQYLLDNIPGTVETCSLCHQLVFHIICCDKCSQFFHHFCLKKYQRKTEKWPCCKSPLSTADLQKQSFENTVMSEVRSNEQSLQNEANAEDGQGRSQTARTRKRHLSAED